MKKKTKKYIKYQATWLISIFLTLTTSWFIWKSWDKIDGLLGQSNIPYIIAGIIILFAIIFGIAHFSFKKLMERV